MRRMLTTSTALPFVIALLVTTGASAGPNTLTSPTRGSGATCTSTDGKTECKCGKFDCVGLATTCQCLKSPQPKSPRPASTNRLSK
jgi:hypothetical protein